MTLHTHLWRGCCLSSVQNWEHRRKGHVCLQEAQSLKATWVSSAPEHCLWPSLPREIKVGARDCQLGNYFEQTPLCVDLSLKLLLHTPSIPNLPASPWTTLHFCRAQPVSSVVLSPALGSEEVLNKIYLRSGKEKGTDTSTGGSTTTMSRQWPDLWSGLTIFQSLGVTRGPGGQI